MKKEKYIPAPGSMEERMLQSIRDILGKIPTESGKPVDGVTFVDEQKGVSTEINFKDIPPTKPKGRV